ncbi:unnamed protein product [Arabis nemorensis]|uniref:Myb-like domain-containing protein n=1 Tax=Arabis nemorensis TaxID=586526 RepID=A0A565C783_9BRAS|nr:unnamed protein product [Arabis nemorensis]
MVDSEAKEDGVKKSKKKRKEIRSDPEAENCVQKSKLRVDSEADDVGNTESGGGNEIGNSEGNRMDEKPLVNNDGKKETVKRKLDDTDLGAEENTDKSNKEIKKKRKKMKPSVVDPELKENNEDSSTKDAINEKEKQNVDSEVVEDDLNSVKDAKKKEKKLSEDAEAVKNNNDGTKDAKKKSKKMKPSVDPEVEECNKDSSTNDAINEKKQNVDSEVVEDDLNSVKDAKKKKGKKKKKKLSENAGAEENNNDTTNDATKEKKKEKKQNVDSEVVENAKDAKKKKRKKKEKLSEDAEAVENNNNDGTKDAKKKRKKKEKSSKSVEDVTTPSSKSTKKVKFSDQLEVFPSEDEVVRGKRFTKEEDALVKKAVLDYIDNHALGDEGLDMVMNCRKYPEIKGCWKEIESALPWRARSSVYYRAHNLFEEGSKGIWTKEDLELLRQFHTKHGNDWKTIADAMGKHRVHVKDAWRRIRLNTNKGHWSREEYQNLFDLVNTDLRMKAFHEKHSKHGMLRDNIPWMAISDKLGTRGHVHCCEKWYNQLTSPMVAKGIWANVDDYRLLDELTNLDAACIDDVDWDNLLENRDGDACRKRWNQMVLHIGSQGSKTFAEQVEILSQRYCPELAEDRENFDNRPFDPED